MEKIYFALNELKEINNFYGLNVDEIEYLQKEIQTAKVCTPLIGKFSAGKSALLNALLGYEPNELLKEDNPATTAVPTEIIYTDSDEKVIVYEGESERTVSLDEYRTIEMNAANVKRVRIEITRTYFEEFKDIMLVDMPGFDSDLEFHDRAIDEYLPKSLAYIIVFAADKMTLESSLIEILKELQLNDMDFCVAITKLDLKQKGYSEAYYKLKADIEKIVHKNFIMIETCSESEDIEQLKDYLVNLQDRAKEILVKKYKTLLTPIFDNTENYLNTVLNHSRLSESDLGKQEETLKDNLLELEERLSVSRSRFDQDIDDCIKNIIGDVQCAIESNESMLLSLVLKGKKIDDKIKSIVRNTVTKSVKERFLPLLNKYKKDINKTINGEALSDINVNLLVNINQFEQGISAKLVAVAATIFMGPLGLVFGYFYSKWNDNKKKQAKHEARIKLNNEIIPQVISEIETKLKTAITEQVIKINDTIDHEFRNQKETLEKAISDIREKINDENRTKEERIERAMKDLERIGEVRNGL